MSTASKRHRSRRTKAHAPKVPSEGGSAAGQDEADAEGYQAPPPELEPIARVFGVWFDDTGPIRGYRRVALDVPVNLLLEAAEDQGATVHPPEVREFVIAHVERDVWRALTQQGGGGVGGAPGAGGWG